MGFVSYYLLDYFYPYNPGTFILRACAHTDIIVKPAMEIQIPVGVRQITEDEIQSELTEAHRSIILNESRLTLMKNLLKRVGRRG